MLIANIILIAGIIAGIIDAGALAAGFLAAVIIVAGMIHRYYSDYTQRIITSISFFLKRISDSFHWAKSI